MFWPNGIASCDNDRRVHDATSLRVCFCCFAFCLTHLAHKYEYDRAVNSLEPKESEPSNYLKLLYLQ